MGRRKVKKKIAKVKKPKREPRVGPYVRPKQTPKPRPYISELSINEYHKKFLCRPYETESFAKKQFKELIEKNKKEIIFPKTIMRFKRGFIPAEYKIRLLVDPEHVKRYRPKPEYDEEGNIIPPKLFLDKWVILKEEPFLVEETFNVFGYNPIRDRKDFAWIYKNLVDSPQDGSLVTAIRYKNKIVFFNENVFNMVICKLESEAKKLYNMLKGVSTESNNSNVHFIGTCAKVNNWRVFDIIQENTGWDKDRIWCKTSTRYK